MTLRKPVFLALMGLTASIPAGCAVIPGPRGGGVGTLANRDVVFPDAAGDAPTLQIAAAPAIRQALEARGYRFKKEARLKVEFGMAMRASEIGFEGAPDLRADLTVPHARPDVRRLDFCHEHIFRMTVAIVDYETGTIAYRGAAERVKCGELGKTDYVALANVALGSLQ